MDRLERIILASLLTSGSKGQALGVLNQLRDGMFIDVPSKTVVQAMLAKRTVDPVVVESIVGAEAFAPVATATSIDLKSQQFLEYLDAIRDEFIKREKLRLINLGQVALSSSVVGDRNWIAQIKDIEYKMSKLNADISGLSSKLHHFSAFQDDVFSHVLKLSELGKKYIGLPSGLVGMDDMTSGFQPTDLTIVAARPGVGKSSLITTVIENLQLLEPDAVVLIFSLEMSKEQILMRLLASIAKVSLHRLRAGVLELSEWARLMYARNYIKQFKVYINDTPAISPSELAAMVREAKETLGRVDLVFVDYLQLMRPDGHHGNRVQEVTELSGAAKGLAKREKIPVVMLSQLSRAPEARTNRRPMLSDLRESGSVEQDADIVMFLYRESLYTPTPDNEYLAELIISKQRNGPTGTIHLAYIKQFTKFENIIFR